MATKRRKGCWRWVLVAALLLMAAAGILVPWAARTPAGRALWNVAEYRVRVLRSKWFGFQHGSGEETGAISGVVRDDLTRPLPEALVLVASPEGQPYIAYAEEYGAYRIDGLPPGRYVPAATLWGYDDVPYRQGTDERTLVEVRPGEVTSGIDFTLTRHRAWIPSLDESPLTGSPELGAALFPAEVYAQRVPVTFTNEGLVITTTLVYRPLDADISSSPALPVLVASYPSEPMNWDRVSVAIASGGYLVVATGPSPQRGLDIPGMARDLLKTVAYLEAGELPGRADTKRIGWLSGSFSSVIMGVALRDSPGGVDALVVVGGISDALLGVQALYDAELEIPPRYATAIASLGRPDRFPEVYVGYSPALHAAHLPPTLVVHTIGDEVIPYDQAERFCEALTAAGVTNELFLYEDTTHYLDQINVTPDTAELYRRLTLFLETYVRGAVD